MTYYAITAQYPIFTDLDGTPLENGYIYIGTQGNNPITNPQTAYWDDDLLYPTAQPIRTLAGAPNRNGSPNQLYCADNFSILIQDKNGNQVYYNQNGVKSYTSQLTQDLKNYVPNGMFRTYQLNSLTRRFDRWFGDSSGYSFSVGNQEIFSTDYDYLPSDIIRYSNIIAGGRPAAIASDYQRYCVVIEDFNQLQGQQVILSWYSFIDGDLDKYAVSLSYIANGSVVQSGIGARIFDATSVFTQNSMVIDLPSYRYIPLNKSYYSNSGLLINFWTAAGSDYDAETSGLGNNTSANTSYLGLADVRLNKGSAIIDNRDISFDQELAHCKRYYERSCSYKESTFSNGSPVTYIAPVASTTIPGFLFNVEKRTATPTVTAYGASSGADYVTHVGTGDIAVSSYDNVSSIGVGTITLASPTVDGGIYQYNYIVDDEFTL